MSTNYYAHYNICECCNRFDEIHIGKSAAGWSFMFQGIVEDDCLGFTLERIDDWELFLEKESVIIYNEYGEEITKSDFWETVRQKSGLKNHCNELRNSHRAMDSEYGFKECWVDYKGNSFTKGEFS